MASYNFKWEHPAEEVYVTGTFDDWTKSVKLEKEDGVFQKTVDLKPSEKIYYKFVVDNNWITNDSSPKEADPEGNVNNFLVPNDIIPVAALFNSVGPESTTATMAGEQPKEPKATPSDIPGGFPETPAGDLDKPLGINPMPAAAGAVNPFTLAPGEKVPDVSATSTTENVKLDKESYEKSDALPGTTAAISTVGAGATTATLAGHVSKEPKVPAVVKESQEKAGVDPEASAVAEEIKEKSQVESELKFKVPEAPSTAEGTAGVGTDKSENTGGFVATAAAAGGAVLAAAIAAKDTIVENATPAVNQATAATADAADKNLPDYVKEKLPVATQEAIAGQSKEGTREEVSPEVPIEVKESIAEANKSPEAAASTAAVVDKKVMETELLKETKTTPAHGETKGKEVKPEVTKAVVPAPAPANASAPVATTDKPSNGANVAAPVPATSTTKPTETTDKTATTDSATDRKKKNRLSAMLSKIKHKISDK